MEKENVKKIKLERELKRAAVLASKDANYLFKGMKAKMDPPMKRKGIRNRTEVLLDQKIDSYRENAYKLEELKATTRVGLLPSVFLTFAYVYMYNFLSNSFFFMAPCIKDIQREEDKRTIVIVDPS